MLILLAAGLDLGGQAAGEVVYQGIGQLGQLVFRTAVDGTPAADNLLRDFRRLSFEKRGGDDEADDVLRCRLQQFEDGFGAFEHEDPFAVTRTLRLDDIPYVGEKVARNGAR